MHFADLLSLVLLREEAPPGVLAFEFSSSSEIRAAAIIPAAAIDGEGR